MIADASATTPIPTFYNVDEAAELLGVSTTTIHRLVKSGELGHHKITRWVRFTPEDIAAFLTATHRDPATPVQNHRRPRVAK